MSGNKRKRGRFTLVAAGALALVAVVLSALALTACYGTPGMQDAAITALLAVFMQ